MRNVRCGGAMAMARPVISVGVHQNPDQQSRR